MLQQMFESSRPQLLIAVSLLGFGLFLLGSGRGASPMLWGGNVGFIFLLGGGLWFFGAWLNAKKCARRDDY